jgi:hypothetical protein
MYPAPVATTTSKRWYYPFSCSILPMNLIKSKKRVADHGEVFTPSWMVEAMLNLVKGETERIDSRFLEPACGSGNFLLPVLPSSTRARR